MEKKAAAATAHHNDLSAQIKAAEKRMAEIAVLRTHIVNYAKTCEVYVAYRKAGYSKKFREEHEEEILLHQAAKNAFDEMGVKKLPKVKELQTEYAKLLEEKKKTTASGKLVLVKSVRRTRSHRMKFCVQRGLGALPSTSKRRGKSQRDFLLCGSVCINTGIACLFSPKMKRTSERIVKFHSLAQFISNFSDNSVSSFTVSCV